MSPHAGVGFALASPVAMGEATGGGVARAEAVEGALGDGAGALLEAAITLAGGVSTTRLEVTGTGGGGIGGAGALGLGREGAAVVCADIDAAAAEATAAQIRTTGGRAAALGLDVRDRSAVEAAVAAAVREFGKIEVLLDCVGVSQTAAFLELDPATWDRIIAVNLTGMFHLGQAAARQMVQQGGGGSVINVTSQLAEVARPERAAYVASKGGGRSLTHAMALELAPHGIRVNAIAPGPTLTGLTRASYADPEKRAPRLRRSRSGQPEDIVGAILFLAADESRWVTGGTVTVDGGYLVQ